MASLPPTCSGGPPSAVVAAAAATEASCPPSNNSSQGAPSPSSSNASLASVPDLLINPTPSSLPLAHFAGRGLFIKKPPFRTPVRGAYLDSLRCSPMRGERGETGDAVAPATGGGARRCRAAQCSGRRTSERGRKDGRTTDVGREGRDNGSWRRCTPLASTEGRPPKGGRRGKIREPYYVTDCEID